MTVVAADSEPVPANAYAPLFDHYAKQHPTPQSAVKAFTFEGTMSPPELKVNTPFKVTYKLTPAQGITLASHKGDDPWPTYRIQCRVLSRFDQHGYYRGGRASHRHGR
jgi:hypothetical protein